MTSMTELFCRSCKQYTSHVINKQSLRWTCLGCQQDLDMSEE